MLTPRQYEIAAMFASGRRRIDIAQALGISIDTVRAHLATARKRTAATDRHSLAQALGVACVEPPEYRVAPHLRRPRAPRTPRTWCSL